MLETIRCVKCDKDHHDIGDTTAVITFSKSDWCASCYHSSDTKEYLYFCSPKCMMEHIASHPELVNFEIK